MARLILGFAGEIASGKGTAAKYIIEKYNGKAFRFSTILRDILDRLYLEQVRQNFPKLSTALRENFGQDLFARVMAQDVKKEPADIIVIDGIRRPDDIKYLKELPEFKFVYIEADIKKCYERILSRDENADDRGKTFEEFEADHQDEPELQIKGMREQADYVVNNDGSLDDLKAQLDKIVAENIR